MKKYTVSNEVPINGTSYQGEVVVTYDILVAIFGEPIDSDRYKVDAEWNIIFENGEVATIYNYKNGKNYLGDDGLDVKNITDWHIGGKSKDVVTYIQDIIKDYIKN
jgi:hypothetical protein